MRSSPTNNNTLLRIQQEISEVAARENELRSNNQNRISNGSSIDKSNGNETRSPSPISPVVSPTPPILTSSFSGPINTNTNTTTKYAATAPIVNGTNTINATNTTRRLFIQNSTSSQKGVMQKFFKTRGKLATAATLSGNYKYTPQTTINYVAWQPTDMLDQPAKALIPADKPLRKGFVPVEEKIQKELRELKQREEQLRTERRKSQPDLMAALEREQEDSLASSGNSQSNSRCSSPIPFPGLLRNARSYSQLVDADFSEDSMLGSLKPARSLAELCDVSDDEAIEKPKNLIQQWELRIRQSQETNN